MSEFPVSGKVDVKVGERSVDKLIDAVVDAFSPVTETLGALGDAVRLGRVEMAALITRRAKQIADDNGMELSAPPLKFLVPFYEKASLEDEENQSLVEMWAALLANAAAGRSEPSPLLADAMAKFSPELATLFENFCNSVSYNVASQPLLQSQKLSEAVNETLLRRISISNVDLSPYKNAASLPYLISNVRFQPNPKYPSIFDQFSLGKSKVGIPPQISVGSTKLYDWGFSCGNTNYSQIGQLVSIGLLREFSFDQDIFEPEIGTPIVRTVLSGFSLTPLGLMLFNATRLG